MKKRLLILLLIHPIFNYAQTVKLNELGRYTDGRKGSSEISTFDNTTNNIFITNAVTDSIDIISLQNLASPIRIGGIDISTYGGGVNSLVNLNNGYIAVAIEATVKQDSGTVVFFTTAGVFTKALKVGSLPDMITVTNDGNKVLVANEGEPNDAYTIDPEGSVSIIDISGGITNLSQSDVTSIRFTSAPTTIAGAVLKPNTPIANELEPEYIAVNKNSTVAAVVCQENNVMVFIDLVNNTILSYKGLGFKNHNLANNSFDPSNKDDKVALNTYNVFGVYQPDAISSFNLSGIDYYISANEGDARDYDGYSSEVRVKDLILDGVAYPNFKNLQEDSVLGRLKTFTADMIGDKDNDGDVDQIYSYGARSFSIWDSKGNLVWDSGNEIETYMEANHIDYFNCNKGKSSKKDSRSDDKGPEPEAVTVGKIGSTTLAFIGLERQGGILVYDISTPTAPVFKDYAHTINSSGVMTDIAPEGLIFIPANKNISNKNLVVVSNEVSGTVTIYEVTITTVSISENKINEIKIYPNPTKGIINLEINSAILANSTIEVFNTIGERVYFNKFTKQINISNLKNGVYYLRASNKDFNTTKKIVINK